MRRPHVGTPRDLLSGKRRRWPATLRVSLALVAVLHGAARAQVVDTTLASFSPSDRVLAIAKLGHTLYLGGNFTAIGPSTGCAVPYDVRTATPLPTYPRIAGRVNTVVADGEGGWYIGGLFQYVGDQPRSNLAHVLADGSVAPWAPDPDQEIFAIALSGGHVYVGGDFNFVGATPRAHLAAFSPQSSVPLEWICDANSRVTSLAVNGPTLYAGGWFTLLANRSRSYVAAVDIASAVPTSWHVDLDDAVSTLALHDTTLFVGGYFSTANGSAHRCLAAVGAITGSVHAWDALVDRQPPSTLDSGPHVRAMLFQGDSLFVAGSFTHIGGQPRQSIAQLDVRTALPTSWDARAVRQTVLGPEFFSMVLDGDSLFVAGPCDVIGGQATGNISLLNSRTAEKLAWDPLTNDFAFAMAVQGNVLFVAGQFTSVRDWVPRHCLAGIDENTGRVTDWDPHPDDTVKSLLAWGGKIYVGGYFQSVGGEPRSCLAALDPITGRATPWNPVATSPIWAMAPMGGSVITAGLAGIFAPGSIGGETRNGIAAIDTATGLVTAWNPAAGGGGDCYAVAATDTAIYVGGDFTSMGGQPRGSIAAVDPITGAAKPWNPPTDGIVSAITLLDGTIYIGGFFHQVAGLPRDFLAAIDGNGSVTPWAPNPFGPNGDGRVEALASRDSTIFAGGFFSGVSGASGDYFAAMDATTGTMRKEYPHPNGAVWALTESDGTIYMGGGFGRVGASPQVAFAAIRPFAPPMPPSSRLELAQAFPNPTRATSVVHYSLPTDLPVSMAVFDLQGRRVRDVLSDPLQAAGPHEVTIATLGLPIGCYIYRLEAGTLRASRKLVVVR